MGVQKKALCANMEAVVVELEAVLGVCDWLLNSETGLPLQAGANVYIPVLL